jgi:saccharopine dehydrogenase-like NADP-dependent oxidoreductase
MQRVVICGGYGTFGLRAAERLGRDPNLEIILAGRNRTAAEAACTDLQPRVAAKLSAMQLDATNPELAALRGLAPAVIYNTSGPFQAQDYSLARAAITIGAHYIDLADARHFVTGITRLDAEAKAAGVLVVSGASSVPGLSSAVVDHHLPAFQRLEQIRFGIVPANGFDPGLATTASILSYVGQPFTTLRASQRVRVHGWQGLWQHRLPDIGKRRLAACDIPDLDLFPVRYPTVTTLTFGAGLEVPAMHYALWALSWLVRLGLVTRPARLAAPLLRMKPWFKAFGSDTGCMFMVLNGTGLDGRPKQIRWSLIARNNQGPYIPQVAATVITRKLLAGALNIRGAQPCLGLLTLPEFDKDVADLRVVSHTHIT